MREGTVHDIPDEKLLERAVKGARPWRVDGPRWTAISDTFGLGSTYSRQLCRRFGLDPEQQVSRPARGDFDDSDG